jgi:hypothetical protein
MEATISTTTGRDIDGSKFASFFKARTSRANMGNGRGIFG